MGRKKIENAYTKCFTAKINSKQKDFLDKNKDVKKELLQEVRSFINLKIGLQEIKNLIK